MISLLSLSSYLLRSKLLSAVLIYILVRLHILVSASVVEYAQYRTYDSPWSTHVSTRPRRERGRDAACTRCWVYGTVYVYLWTQRQRPNANRKTQKSKNVSQDQEPRRNDPRATAPDRDTYRTSLFGKPAKPRVTPTARRVQTTIFIVYIYVVSYSSQYGTVGNL